MSALSKVIRAVAISGFLMIGAVGAQAKTPLYVYDFNLGMTPTGRVDYLKSLGVSGLVSRVKTSADVRELRAYANHVLTVDDFELLAFVAYDFTDNNTNVWRQALPVLARTGTPLWVIVRNAPSTGAIDRLLRQMADESQAHGIQTVIYPHYDTDIETAAEASVFLDRIKHPNLKNSLHTCHEIRAGNQYDMRATVRAGVRRTSLVTIAGADDNAYSGPPFGAAGWGDAIKPLDEGGYSLLPFLQALEDSSYRGPVILHTFGITNNPGHLERSIAKYAEYLGSVIPRRTGRSR